jgi:hypothetical protein
MGDRDPAVREMGHDLQRAAQGFNTAPQGADIQIQAALQGGDARRLDLEALRELRLGVGPGVLEGLPWEVREHGLRLGGILCPACRGHLGAERVKRVMSTHDVNPLRLWEAPSRAAVGDDAAGPAGLTPRTQTRSATPGSSARAAQSARGSGAVSRPGPRRASPCPSLSPGPPRAG